jgi:hypothetical protein
MPAGADKDGDNFDVFSQFAGYFTIENSIKGMKVLVRVLFSIAIREVNIPIEGQWDIYDVASDATSLLLAGNNNGGGDGLRKFIFHHEVDGIIKTMYFDLHLREGKLCANRSISLHVFKLFEHGGGWGRWDQTIDYYEGGILQG